MKTSNKNSEMLKTSIGIVNQLNFCLTQSTLLIVLFLLIIVKQASAQSGNIDQARNGSASSPTNPVQWVNGNAGASNSHYLESLSIPYRMVVTGLTAGTHNVDIEWDVKQSGTYAIDYITNFNRLQPHTQFQHTAEVINPLQGLTGINAIPVTFAIPVPTSNKAVVCSGLSQPKTSFNALPANEKLMTMYNGTSITSMQYLNLVDLTGSTCTQKIRITFTTANATVVFAWGGHIAAAADWCPGNSASNISGSPYHMRLFAVDGNGGNQDRSLSAAAIIPVPPCNILGNENICRSQVVTYSVNPYIGYTYTWSLANNTSGASISGATVGSSVLVNSGSSNGSFTLNLLMSTSGFTGICTKIINVSKPALTETHLNYSCGTNTGSINLTVTGGFAPYTYSWSNGATTEDLSGLTAGVYTVTVSDQASCTTPLTVNITSLTSLSVTPNVTNVSCFQGSTGTVNLNVSGGSAPYSYSWSNGATTQNITALVAGSYSVMVTDAAQCAKSVAVSISQPAALTSTGFFTAPTCFNGNDGAASVVVNGGTAPFSYSWNTSPVKTSASATGLSAGTYTCYITDAKGCSVSSTVVLPETVRIVTNVTISGNTTICDGGSVTLTAGTSNSYLWSTGATTQSITVNAAGSYLVTVTNGQGCTSTSAAVTVIVNSNPTATVTGGSISCKRNETTVSLTAATNVGNATFTWSGTNFSSSLQNPVVSVGGIYSVLVTNPTTGCFSTASATVNQNTLAPSASASGGLINCTNPSLTLTSSSNTAGVNYNWTGPNGFAALTQNPVVSAAGTYTVVVVNPINECYTSATALVTANINLPQVTATGGHISCKRNEDSLFIASNSSLAITNYNWTGPNGFVSSLQNPRVTVAGNYVVSVTDPSNGCSTSATANVTGPAAMSASATTTSNLCNGSNTGSATGSVIGGTAPFTYQWNTNPAQTTATINQQFAGSYTIVVTDADGCSVSAIAVIAEPAQITIATNLSKNVTCRGGNDGQAGGTITGGTAPYTFSWNTVPVQTTALATGLKSASYVLYVTDANGCAKQFSFGITQPAALVVNKTIQQVSCNGVANGSISITSITGGTSPYTYVWNTTPVQTSATISNLAPGQYTLTVTDSKGCTLSITYSITQPQILSTKTIFANVTCNGGNNGTASITGVGGTAPYSYSWNTIPSQSTSTISNLTASSYTIFITDARGCTKSKMVTISQPTTIAVSTTITPVTCRNEDDGAIALTVSGGTAPYSYTWSNGAITSSIINLIPGIYTYTITDGVGCTKSESITILSCNAIIVRRTMQNEQVIETTLNNEISSTIYPNPSNGAASVNVLVYSDTKMLMQVFKSDGAELATLFSGDAKANTPYTFAINAANELAPGVYMVRIQTNALTVVRKLIIKN